MISASTRMAVLLMDCNQTMSQSILVSRWAGFAAYACHTLESSAGPDIFPSDCVESFSRLVEPLLDYFHPTGLVAFLTKAAFDELKHQDDANTSKPVHDLHSWYPSTSAG